MPDRIDHIVIVGGGTAGWMSAAYLQKVLSGKNSRPFRLTVVESDDIGIIGVGEATIPSIRAVLQLIDIPEWRLLKEADATFKNAIKFVDWAKVPQDGISSHFYHAFDLPPVRDGFNAMTHWMAMREAGIPVPQMCDAISVQSALCDAGLSPKQFQSRPYEAPVPYAYHLDAVKLGRLLREVAMERGVERIVDHVTDVVLDETGEIGTLKTRDGRAIEGDFFIDCSGFNALLIEKTLGEPFIDYSDRLLCDRAIACQVPLDGTAPPRPYTTATAQSAGWTWEIDLSHRRGTGYVYSSRFISDDDAEKELLAHIGAGPEVPLAPRRLQMRIGRHRRAWVKNCLAIGLSAGFIEPLESTGIHFVELALGLFVDYFAEGHAMPPLQNKFNQIFASAYDEVANFVLLHYIFNQRTGLPFWDHYREGVILPPALVDQLRVWAYKIPSSTDFDSKVNIFNGFNYFMVMAGMNTLPPFGNNLTPIIDLEKSAALLDEIATARQSALDNAPPHAEILQKIRSVAG